MLYSTPCTSHRRAVFVNGGAVTILMLGTNLWEHRKAVAAERALQKRVKARKAE